MKKYMFIFLCIILYGCNYNFDEIELENIDKIESIIYDVYVNDTKIGETVFTFTNTNDGYIVLEEKKYIAEFINEEKQEVINKKEYYFSEDSKLNKFIEREYIDGELSIENLHDIEYNNEYIYVDINNNQKIKVFPNSNINMSSYSSGMIDIILNKELEKNKYYFYFNTLGNLETFYVDSIEKIRVAGTEEIETYRLYNENVFETNIWIDQEEGIMVKKEEKIDDSFIINTVIRNYEFK